MRLWFYDPRSDSFRLFHKTPTSPALPLAGDDAKAAGSDAPATTAAGGVPPCAPAAFFTHTATDGIRVVGFYDLALGVPFNVPSPAHGDSVADAGESDNR